MSFTYPDAVIYRIKCLVDNTYYIGSAINLERRIKKHKSEPHLTNAESIIKTGNYNFKILEECPCNIKNEIFPTEQKYIDRYRGKYDELVLNKNNPFPTEEQIKEKQRIRTKKWANNNPEKIKLSNAKQYQKNKPVVNKKSAQWRKDNPEQVKLNNAKRKNSEIVECPCGGRFKKCNKSNHINRSQIHKIYISKINENKI